MILSQRQLEEIAASTTKDFNRFFFGDEADKPDRSALPTPIDPFAKNYSVFAYHSPVSRRTEASAVSLCERVDSGLFLSGLVHFSFRIAVIECN